MTHSSGRDFNITRLRNLLFFSFGWMVCTNLLPEFFMRLFGLRFSELSAFTLAVGVVLLAAITIYLCVLILRKSAVSYLFISGGVFLVTSQLYRVLVRFDVIILTSRNPWYRTVNAFDHLFTGLGLVMIGLALFYMLLEILSSREDLRKKHIQLLHEIDMRKILEKNLHEREVLLDGINNSALDGIIVVDAAGSVTFWNAAAARIMGYRAEDITGASLEKTLALEGFQHLLTRTSAPDSRQPLEPSPGTIAAMTARKKDGNLIDVELSLSSMEMFGQTGNVIILRDITRRKEAEQEYKTIVETTLDGFVILDDAGRIIDVNNGYCAMTGYTREELLTLEISDIEANESPDETAAHVRKIQQEGFDRFETRQRRKDGSLVHIEVTANSRIHDGQHRLYAFLRDITERRRFEQEQRDLESQVQYGQKLESLGVLAGGVAHDFNNILQIILGNVNMLEKDIPGDAPTYRFIENLKRSVDRATGLTSQMLAYSGRRSGALRALNLGDVVQMLVPLIRSSISKKVALQTHLMKNLPLIEADAAQVEQVVMNLILNAAEALDEEHGGVVMITTTMLYCTREYLQGTRALYQPPEGSYVCLEVADTGCGMSKETLEKFFEPFFTTKFTGRGLGMSATLGIMRAHKGAIVVESAVGQGTVIRALFPPTDLKPESIAETRDEASVVPFSKGRTILVVDDEPDVLELASDMLKQQECSVLTAEDGLKALEVFRKHSDVIDCVLLDLSMPHMDGIQTVLALRHIKPAIPVILASGYTEQDLGQRVSGQEISAFLQKPYDASLLAEVLRKVLG